MWVSLHNSSAFILRPIFVFFFILRRNFLLQHWEEGEGGGVNHLPKKRKEYWPKKGENRNVKKDIDEGKHKMGVLLLLFSSSLFF